MPAISIVINYACRFCLRPNRCHKNNETDIKKAYKKDDAQKSKEPNHIIP